jgi:hypothetical protein
MLGSLGTLALALAPVYLTYRVWQHYAYTKTLEVGKPSESLNPRRE